MKQKTKSSFLATAFGANAEASPAMNNKWALDSGSNAHLVDNKIKVNNKRATDEIVEVAGGACVRANYSGNVIIDTPNGETELRNVLAIPGLKMN